MGELKILQFNRYSILERPGGTYRYIDGLSQSLAQQGHQVYLFTTTRQGMERLSWVKRVPGYWIIQLRVNSSRLKRLWEYFIEVPRQIYKLDRALEFDAVISHDPYLPVGLNSKRMCKSPDLVWFFYISASYEAAYNASRMRLFQPSLKRSLDKVTKTISISLQWILEHRNLSHANRIIVLSEYTQQMLAWQHGKEMLRKTVLIPGGVDIRRFCPGNQGLARAQLGLPENAVILFTVRNLSPRMGLENLIRAMYRVKEVMPSQDVRLYIGGKGLLKEVLEQMIRDLRLEGVVYLVGYIDEKTLPLYYQACDFFVLPTEALEGFGMVILEALATNKPVIGTPIGAIPEILLQFSPDLITRGVGPEDLASKLIECISDKDAIVSNWRSRSLVEARYGWNVIARQVADVISP